VFELIIFVLESPIPLPHLYILGESRPAQYDVDTPYASATNSANED